MAQKPGKYRGICDRPGIVADIQIILGSILFSLRPQEMLEPWHKLCGMRIRETLIAWLGLVIAHFEITDRKQKKERNQWCDSALFQWLSAVPDSAESMKNANIFFKLQCSKNLLNCLFFWTSKPYGNKLYKLQGWASVLFKRTFRSLRSFPFFIKERSVTARGSEYYLCQSL